MDKGYIKSYKNHVQGRVFITGACIGADDYITTRQLAARIGAVLLTVTLHL